MAEKTKGDAISPWTIEKENVLVEMWSVRDFLYDVSSRGYSDRQLKRQSLEECSSVLAVPVSEITKRMASLRTQYSRLLKPTAISSRAKKITQRQEWLLKNMGFLAPHVKPRSSGFNPQNGELDELEEIEQLKDEDEGEEDYLESSLDDLHTEPPAKTPPPLDYKYKRRKTSVETNTMTSLNLTTDRWEENDDNVFGKHLIWEMKKITNERTKLQLQQKIMNLVFDARMDQIAAPKTNESQES